MRNFRKYDIWKDSIAFVDKVYKLVEHFPAKENYGLTSQLTRSSISLPSNIAEGASRESEKDFARFLEISLGSAFELETQLLIAGNRNYVERKLTEDLINELISMQKRIAALRKKVLNKK